MTEIHQNVLFALLLMLAFSFILGGLRGPGRLLRFLLSPVLGLVGCLMKVVLAGIVIALLFVYGAQSVKAPLMERMPDLKELPLALNKPGPVADIFDYPVGNPGPDGRIAGAGWIVTQDFEDTLNAYSPALSGRHLGEDWAAAAGSAGKEVYAIADGLVIRSEPDHSYGHLLMIRHPLPKGSEYPYVVSFYGHLGSEGLLSSTEDGKPRRVAKGDIIGHVGAEDENGVDRNGKPWRPHLHFELRADRDKTGHADDYINTGYNAKRRGYLNPTDATSKGNKPGGGWIDRHR